MDAEEFIEAAMRIGHMSREDAEDLLASKPTDIPLEDVTEQTLRMGILQVKHRYGDMPKE